MRVAQSVDRNNVKMRVFDLDGVPVDEKDLKSWAKTLAGEVVEEDEGEVLFEINAGVDPSLPIAPNIDYQYEEMTDEQREVFKALEEEVLEYEELEDDFVALASGNKPVLTKPVVLAPVSNLKTEDPIRGMTLAEVSKVIDQDIKQVSGSQLSAQEFKAIIAGDKKALGIDSGAQKSVKTEDPESAPKGVLKLGKALKKAEKQQQKAEKAAEEETLQEDKPTSKQVQFAPNDIGLEDFDLMGIGHKRARKGESYEEETVQVLPGGGKLIFRKLKKTTQTSEQESTTDKAKEQAQAPKTAKPTPQTEQEAEEEWSDYDDSYDSQEDQVEGEEVSEDELGLDDYETDDAPHEQLPYKINEKHSIRSKSDDANKEYSESEGEDLPLTNDQLKQLYKDYKDNKARANKKSHQKDQQEAEEEEEEEEVVKVEPYDFKSDKLAQACQYEDTGKPQITDIDFTGESKPTGHCAPAPSGSTKHTNYFYMQVVNDNDDVKPLPPKPKKQKIDKTQHKIDSKVPERKRNETKEEKAERKRLAKEIKEAKRERNREFKDQFKRMKNEYTKQQNKAKEADPLTGVSKHVISGDN